MIIIPNKRLSKMYGGNWTVYHRTNVEDAIWKESRSYNTYYPVTKNQGEYIYRFNQQRRIKR